MSILIKKFVSSSFCTPKLTYTIGDTEFTANFTEEWGPEFGNAVQSVEELAMELFRIGTDHLSRMELGSAEWVTKDGRTKYRISAEAILKTRPSYIVGPCTSYIVGPCTLKTPWLNEEDLDGIADDAVQRMEALREVCAEYVIGRQRAQMELFRDDELDISSAGMLRQVQREDGKSKIDNLNQQYLSDNPDIASRILSQEGGE